MQTSFDVPRRADAGSAERTRAAAAPAVWVFCCGMRRSGSTVHYQMAADLVERLGAGAARGWVEPEQFADLKAAAKDATGFQVVKCHRYIPDAAVLAARGEALGLYSYRDIRDVVVSMSNKSGVSFWPLVRSGFVQTLLDDYGKWTTLPRVLVSQYETMTRDLAAEVRRMGAHLGVDIDAGVSEQFAGQYSLQAQRQRIERFDFNRDGVGQGTLVHDPGTLLHRNHIRSGGVAQWRHSLSALQVALVEDLAREWLINRGYGVSRSFVARKLAMGGFVSWKAAMVVASRACRPASARS